MRRIEKKIEIIRRGLKRNLERKLHCLSPASIVVLFFITLGISLAWLSDYVSKKVKRQK